MSHLHSRMPALALAIALLLPLPAAAQEAPAPVPADTTAEAPKPGTPVAVAVLDLQASGVPAELVSTLTEAVLSEIAKVQGIKAVGMADIRTMLDLEQEKQLLGCDDAGCIAEIGGALGVDQIASGNVGKVGETFVIQLKLINIRTAEVLRRVDRQVSGSEERVLSVCRALAVELMTGQAAAREGRLAISVKQQGALVSVNGKAIGLTPLPEPLTLEEGVHDLKITKDGFKDFSKDVRVTNAAEAAVEVVLEAKKKPVKRGFLALDVNESGAMVSVDGKPAGVTPLTQPIETTPGKHLVRVVKTGFRPWQSLVEIVEKQTVNTTATLDEASGAPPWGVVGYSLLGLAALAGGGAGYAGYTATQAHKDYEAATNKSDAEEFRAQTEERALITDVLIGTASLAGAAALIFLVLDWTSGSDEGSETIQAGAYIVPTDGGAAAGLGLRY